jgi:hypothetical protein
MKRLLLLSTLTAGLSLALISSAGAETYGGDATAAQVTVPATGTTIRAATGTLSITGGGVESSLLVGDIPSNLTGGVVSLTAGALHSAVFGVGTLSSADSSLGDVGLTISGNQISSDFLMGRSKSRCGPGPSIWGESHAENLVINGQPIIVTGAPNQTIALPNGTVIVNEQTGSIVGNTSELRVTALHVTTRDAVTGAQLADVMLATVDAKHGCEELPPDQETETSGGGFIAGVAGGKAKFGVFVKLENGVPKGHLVFKDPSVNFSMKSTSITSVTTTGCQTTFSGSGDSNRGPLDFVVTVTDGGEPGQGKDFFEIHTTSAPPYDNAGFLGGGDIEVEGDSCHAS